MSSFSVGWIGIDTAIRRIEQYRTELLQKCEQLQARLAEELAITAQQGFNSAGIDDWTQKGMRPASVSVTANGDGIGVVVASGEDAIWVEFGAGVFHNGPVGKSPHPVGAELGMTIGGYGQGRGEHKVWAYEEGGYIRWTHGTPAQMPMYRAAQELAPKVLRIAKEVFGG